MKYHREGTQYPELKDFEPPKPERLREWSRLFKDLCGATVLMVLIVGVMPWLLFSF